MDAPIDVRPGDVLAGKYRIERLLGQGGMGVVVAATHIQLDERVAIKFLLPAALQNPEAVARFAREARAAVKIKSEHVARVTDVGMLDTGCPYMVMEYLHGCDLGGLVQQRGPLPPDEAVDYVLQAAEAIAEAHSIGIIHRDLKPANLFLTRDGVLKVLDFGVARLRDASGGNATLTGATLGTPAYMAPEQAFGKASELDAKADLWAVGATLFSLISGRFVHEGDGPQQVLAKLATRSARSLATVAPAVPLAVAQVVDRALAFEKRERWPSAAAMKDALQQAYSEAFGSALSAVSADSLAGLLEAHGDGAASAGGGLAERDRHAKLRGHVWLAIALLLAALMVSAVALSIRAALPARVVPVSSKAAPVE